jgi:hypothetical protein
MASEAKQQENKPKNPREIALDAMCSTLRAAYREWERKEGSKRQ